MVELFVSVFLVSFARILFNYSRLENVLNRSQAELEDVRKNDQYTKMQLDVVYSKINPHFLYNSLNSIAGLATADGNKARDMAIALSKLLRYSLNYSENKFATLEEEAGAIRTYCDIEKIRFEDRLKYEIFIPDDIKAFQVPRFLLQPLVENCIKHAFGKSEEGILIRITAMVENNEIVITIHDNGQPFPDQINPGYGFRNVNDKLHLLFPDKYTFEIINQPEKNIRITIRQPDKINASQGKNKSDHC